MPPDGLEATTADASPPMWPVGILQRSIFALILACHGLGNIFLVSHRLALPPAEWTNPLYAVDSAKAFYIIHFIAFGAFNYVSYFVLARHPRDVRALAGFWISWLIAGIVTVIPLLPVQRSRQLLGVGVYLVSGVLANVLQVGGALYLGARCFYKRSAVPLSWYLAFLVVAGFNTSYLPFKILLADSPGVNAVVASVIMAVHLVFAGAAVKRPFGREVGLTEGKSAGEGKALKSALLVIVPTLGVPIAWFASCKQCGRDG